MEMVRWEGTKEQANKISAWLKILANPEMHTSESEADKALATLVQWSHNLKPMEKNK